METSKIESRENDENRISIKVAKYTGTNKVEVRFYE